MCSSLQIHYHPCHPVSVKKTCIPHSGAQLTTWYKIEIFYGLVNQCFRNNRFTTVVCVFGIMSTCVMCSCLVHMRTNLYITCRFVLVLVCGIFGMPSWPNVPHLFLQTFLYSIAPASSVCGVLHGNSQNKI